MQGLNILFNVTRINYSSDDIVGGAVTTGTVLHSGLRGRIEGNLVQQDILSLNPGLETEKIFRVTMQPGNLDIQERDYFVITSPTDHPYYNEDFRIIKVTYSNFVPSDYRDYMILTLSKSEQAHAIQ